ncbi:DUF3349 domain-containing protein [Embleya sp. NPDC005575]|uniref:DUF3349 domain-containing protein n=1 Tax=Embleya sp. NPDC005575 TaxID=3156892 RepID=UPI0033AD7F1B
MSIPEYLQEAYVMLTSAYPNGVPDAEYPALVGALKEGMSLRNIGDVLAELIGQDPIEGYLDALGSDLPSADPDVARVREKLAAFGWDPEIL